MDHEINRIVEVRFPNKGAYCDYYAVGDCEHVRYAWTIPKVARVLEEHGLKPPG